MKNLIIAMGKFLLVCILFLGACTQMEEIPVQEIADKNVSPTTQPKFDIVDGRLVFANSQDFFATLKFLEDKQQELDKWESKLKGYTSMRKTYMDITEEEWENIGQKGSIEGYEDVLTIITNEDGEQEVEFVVGYGVLATLINSNGFLQVGEKVQKYMYEYLIEVPLEMENQIERIMVAPESFPDYVFKAERTKISSESLDSRAYDSSCKYTYNPSGYSKRRVKGYIHGTFYNNSTPFYYFFTRTQHKKKVAFFYVLSDAPYLRAKADITVSWSGGFPFSQSLDTGKIYNANTASKGTASSGQRYQRPRVVASGEHTARRMDNENMTVNCYTAFVDSN